MWFQNRRAKFRKQERLNQQKQNQQGSNNSNNTQQQQNNTNTTSSTSPTSNTDSTAVSSLKEANCVIKDTKPNVLAAINADTKTLNGE